MEIAAAAAATAGEHYLVYQNPVQLRLLPLLLGQLAPVHCVRWVPGQPSLLHLLRRPGCGPGRGQERQPHAPAAAAAEAAGARATYALPPAFVMHHANAHVDRNGMLVLDSVQYDAMPDFWELSGPGSDFRQADPSKQPVSRLVRSVQFGWGDLQGARVVAGALAGVSSKQVPAASSRTPPTFRPCPSPCRTVLDLSSGSASTSSCCDLPLEFPRINDQLAGQAARWAAVLAAASSKRRPGPLQHSLDS
jgi:carotenoid cleavage dioxygenase-like enzyme